MARPENDLRRWLKKWSRTALFVGAFYLLVLEPLWNLLLTHFQAEATTGLNTMVYGEKIYYQSAESWSENFSDIGFGFDDDNRYAFFISPAAHQGRTLAELGLSLPVDFAALGAPEPGLTDDGFVAVAIGNIDLDDELDVWWVDQTGHVRNPRSDVWGIWRLLLALYQRMFNY